MAKKNEARSRNKSGVIAEGPSTTVSGKTNAPLKAASSSSAPSSPHEVKDGLRETVESIVIAFVLAFLFRTFEAEAFVIPTGSMAPTLMGQHKDLVCNKCRFPYRVGASQEVAPDNVTNKREREQFFANNRLMECTCPNCRYEMRFGRDEPDGVDPPPSYKGDRILVGKLAYEVSDPRRWDVAVFKYPEQAKVNFIKRLVGLPDETVVIHHGDLSTTSKKLANGPINAQTIANMKQQGTLAIARKSPAKVQAMLQNVYDNSYPLPEPWFSKFPARWTVGPQSRGAGWEALDEGRRFRTNGESSGDSWIAYRHLTPSSKDWQTAMQTRELAKPIEIAPELITDFYAYNTGRQSEFNRGNWVGDLSLDCRMKADGSEGEALLALVEGGCVFECRIELASGQATFSISQDPSFKATVSTAVRGPGSHQVEFANIDDQLFLWVDGAAIEFDGRYGPLANLVPNDDDLLPARVGSRGAAVEFDQLRLRRDVYYISDRHRGFDVAQAEPGSDEYQWVDGTAFWLGPDEFMMLGDNSPQSKDSRFWGGRDEQGRNEYYVKRELLIGKALY
ncbi:MAG TPA: signal peptidase I, partial [Pirellulales bacterium]|nr:signal peptidase I [Pirellulales bacterium]